MKPINVTTFFQELVGDIDIHCPDRPHGSISYVTLGMTLAEYSVVAEKLQSAGLFADGYHTFDELYAHRVRLFSTLMRAYPEKSWWSDKHHDGTSWEGWILAGIDTPAGTATYHLPVAEVEQLSSIARLERGKEWDGHTADDVLERLKSL